MAEYEEKDALYAELELQQSLSDEISRHLTTMRMTYLDYQVHYGEMLEYQNRTLSHASSDDNSSDDLLRRIDEHQYHHQIALIADHHDDLARLHHTMALLNEHPPRPGLSKRHKNLARGHLHLQRICRELMGLLEVQYNVDPDDRQMLDSLETTPEGPARPDTSDVL
jgi:hypothetical protein